MSVSASSGRPTHDAAPSGERKSYFEEQREMLLNEIAQSMEHVLQNMNKLNRSLEGVIAVGNEFSSVEALWSQFENVMARDSADEGRPEEGRGGGNGTDEEKAEADVGAEQQGEDEERRR